MKIDLLTIIALSAVILCGCARSPQKAASLSFHYVAEKPTDSTRSAVVNGETIHIIGAPAIESPMIEDSYTILDDRGHPNIIIKFAEPAISEFAALSKRTIGKRLAIVVSGETVAAPLLREPVLNGVISVSGRFSAAKAEEIVTSILGLDHLDK